MDDAPEVFEAANASQAEIGRWMDWCHKGLQLSEIEQFIAARPILWEVDHDYTFGVFDLTGGFLGCCSINQVVRTHQMAHLGYWIRTSKTGQGFASEAACGLVDFGFKKLGLNRLEVVVITENSGSRRVADKIGAQREGVARERLMAQGVGCDATVFSILARDWAG